MTIQEKIIKIMEVEKMNAKQLSQELGISQGTLSNALGGRNNPSLLVMQLILKRFVNIRAEWLIMDRGEMYRKQEVIQTSLFEDIVPNASVSPTTPKDINKVNEVNDNTENTPTPTIEITTSNSTHNEALETTHEISAAPHHNPPLADTIHQPVQQSLTPSSELVLEQPIQQPVLEQTGHTVSEQTATPILEKETVSAPSTSRIEQSNRRHIERVIIFYSDKTYEINE